VKKVRKEPVIRVGLMTRAAEVKFSLEGGFATAAGEQVPDGDYTARVVGGVVRVEGKKSFEAGSFIASPADFDSCRVTIQDVVIGIDFHWERCESQQFQGAIGLTAGADGLTIVNELPLESYLVSVISSEMSALCPPELLRAHAIVSRSWLLAQLLVKGESKNNTGSRSVTESADGSTKEIIRWYDRENHIDFDVCADDHCQRYQGISKAFSRASFDAVNDTAGVALVFDDEVCDARYSKSCGGMTEIFGAAWEDKSVPYLSAVYDWQGSPDGYGLPLSEETNAERWITSAPAAFCNANSPDLMARILPGFDQETLDFYRWEVIYTQQEIQDLIGERLGEDVGEILSLDALARGESARIIRLQIRGKKKTLVIGKELEIRRALSRSHLYSSAFVARAEGGEESGTPHCFRLIGAGWGHGVGLCQIGAAVMADRGEGHEEILAHYFRGATLTKLY
jgi:SpoIID/LytB domain protein